MKRCRSFETPVVHKRREDDPDQQRLIGALQSRIKALEDQLQLQQQLAYQALREQERAFLEWQRQIESTCQSFGRTVPTQVC